LANNRLRRKPMLPYNLEELVSYGLMVERKIFGLIAKNIKGRAFEFGIKNGLVCPFSVQQGRAAWKWLCKFRCRHPRLRLRKPQATSAVRGKGLAKENVANVFVIFEPLLRLINSSPHRLCRNGYDCRSA